MKAKINFKNIYYYLQGNYRLGVYYSQFDMLLPKHIREQISYRLNSMNTECKESGSCIKCGCSTPGLQMCNRACEGNCYPKMLDRRTWNRLMKQLNICETKKLSTLPTIKSQGTEFSVTKNKFIKHELERKKHLHR